MVPLGGVTASMWVPPLSSHSSRMPPDGDSNRITPSGVVPDPVMSLRTRIPAWTEAPGGTEANAVGEVGATVQPAGADRLSRANSTGRTPWFVNVSVAVTGWPAVAVDSPAIDSVVLGGASGASALAVTR